MITIMMTMMMVLMDLMNNKAILEIIKYKILIIGARKNNCKKR